MPPMTTTGNSGRWFVLHLDDSVHSVNTAADSAEAGNEPMGAVFGKIVQVQRAQGDCCGCCGPIHRDPRYGNSPLVPFWGMELGVGRLVGGAVASIAGVVSATLLTVVVWSLDSYADAVASGAIEIGSGELGSGQ